MGFYDDTLLSEGWEQLGEVDRSGTSTYRGDWTHGRWTMRVSANDANGLGGDRNPSERVVSQYSLVLPAR